MCCFVFESVMEKGCHVEIFFKEKLSVKNIFTKLLIQWFSTRVYMASEGLYMILGLSCNKRINWGSTTVL